MGQKFVEWWIEKPDGGRMSVERLENSDVVFSLIRQKFRKRLLTVSDGVGEDHLPHRVYTLSFEEHMLRPAESDSCGTESNRVRRLFRRVRVCADLHAADPGAPIHQ